MRLTLTLFFVFFAVGAKVSAENTPAQDRIAFVNAQLTKTPDKSSLYTEFAIALVRRERETSDTSLLGQAQSAVDKSLKFAPENLEAEKVEAAILLGQHEFQKALVLAQSINKKVPDDVLSYGYIADADLALGDYDAAEKAAQWMLDLRPDNVPGLIRGAELRQIFGDTDGALQFLNSAYQQTSSEQTEDSAWILTRMAELNLAVGKLDIADQLLQKASASFPDYYYSLEVLARLRSAQTKYAEAADLLHRRNQQFPQLQSLYAEAEALDRAGNPDKAKTLYTEFEKQARAVMSRPNNDNRDLILYYISYKHDPAEAVRIAALETSQRHDVETLDAYAVALYANHDYSQAQKQIEKAMAPGIRDAAIFYHAAQITPHCTTALRQLIICNHR